MPDSAYPGSQVVHQIGEDDLDEIDVIGSMVLRAAENKSTDALFALYQRLKHITSRVRGIFEE